MDDAHGGGLSEPLIHHGSDSDGSGPGDGARAVPSSPSRAKWVAREVSLTELPGKHSVSGPSGTVTQAFAGARGVEPSFAGIAEAEGNGAAAAAPSAVPVQPLAGDGDWFAPARGGSSKWRDAGDGRMQAVRYRGPCFGACVALRAGRLRAPGDQVRDRVTTRAVGVCTMVFLMCSAAYVTIGVRLFVTPDRNMELAQVEVLCPLSVPDWQSDAQSLQNSLQNEMLAAIGRVGQVGALQHLGLVSDDDAVARGENIAEETLMAMLSTIRNWTWQELATLNTSYSLDSPVGQGLGSACDRNWAQGIAATTGSGLPVLSPPNLVVRASDSRGRPLFNTSVRVVVHSVEQGSTTVDPGTYGGRWTQGVTDGVNDSNDTVAGQHRLRPTDASGYTSSRLGYILRGFGPGVYDVVVHATPPPGIRGATKLASLRVALLDGSDSVLKEAAEPDEEARAAPAGAQLQWVEPPPVQIETGSSLTLRVAVQTTSGRPVRSALVYAEACAVADASLPPRMVAADGCQPFGPGTQDLFWPATQVVRVDKDGLATLPVTVASVSSTGVFKVSVSLLACLNSMERCAVGSKLEARVTVQSASTALTIAFPNTLLGAFTGNDAVAMVPSSLDDPTTHVLYTGSYTPAGFVSSMSGNDRVVPHVCTNPPVAGKMVAVNLVTPALSCELACTVQRLQQTELPPTNYTDGRQVSSFGVTSRSLLQIFGVPGADATACAHQYPGDPCDVHLGDGMDNYGLLAPEAQRLAVTASDGCAAIPKFGIAAGSTGTLMMTATMDAASAWQRIEFVDTKYPDFSALGYFGESGGFVATWMWMYILCAYLLVLSNKGFDQSIKINICLVVWNALTVGSLVIPWMLEPAMLVVVDWTPWLHLHAVNTSQVSAGYSPRCCFNDPADFWGDMLAVCTFTSFTTVLVLHAWTMVQNIASCSARTECCPPMCERCISTEDAQHEVPTWSGLGGGGARRVGPQPTSLAAAAALGRVSTGDLPHTYRAEVQALLERAAAGDSDSANSGDESKEPAGAEPRGPTARGPTPQRRQPLPPHHWIFAKWRAPDGEVQRRRLSTLGRCAVSLCRADSHDERRLKYYQHYVRELLLFKRRRRKDTEDGRTEALRAKLGLFDFAFYRVSRLMAGFGLGSLVSVVAAVICAVVAVLQAVWWCFYVWFVASTVSLARKTGSLKAWGKLAGMSLIHVLYVFVAAVCVCAKAMWKVAGAVWDVLFGSLDREPDSAEVDKDKARLRRSNSLASMSTASTAVSGAARHMGAPRHAKTDVGWWLSVWVASPPERSLMWRTGTQTASTSAFKTWQTATLVRQHMTRVALSHWLQSGDLLDPREVVSAQDFLSREALRRVTASGREAAAKALRSARGRGGSFVSLRDLDHDAGSDGSDAGESVARAASTMPSHLRPGPPGLLGNFVVPFPRGRPGRRKVFCAMCCDPYFFFPSKLLWATVICLGYTLLVSGGLSMVLIWGPEYVETARAEYLSFMRQAGELVSLRSGYTPKMRAVLVFLGGLANGARGALGQGTYDDILFYVSQFGPVAAFGAAAVISITWVLMMLQYRRRILDMRAGNYFFNKKQVSGSLTAQFIGYQLVHLIAGSLLVFSVIFVLAVFAVVLILVDGLAEQLGGLFLAWLITLLPSLTLWFAIRFMGGMLVDRKQHIRDQTNFAIYDYATLIVQLQLGILLVAKRLALLGTYLLTSFWRLDLLSGTNASFDTGYKTYIAMSYEDYWHNNNPIMLCFVNILSKEVNKLRQLVLPPEYAASRARSRPWLLRERTDGGCGVSVCCCPYGGCCGDVPTRKPHPHPRASGAYYSYLRFQRVLQRWHLFLMLHRHPKLRRYRKHRVASGLGFTSVSLKASVAGPLLQHKRAVEGFMACVGDRDDEASRGTKRRYVLVTAGHIVVYKSRNDDFPRLSIPIDRVRRVGVKAGIATAAGVVIAVETGIRTFLFEVLPPISAERWVGAIQSAMFDEGIASGGGVFGGERRSDDDSDDNSDGDVGGDGGLSS